MYNCSSLLFKVTDIKKKLFQVATKKNVLYLAYRNQYEEEPNKNCNLTKIFRIYSIHRKGNSVINMEIHSELQKLKTIVPHTYRVRL